LNLPSNTMRLRILIADDSPQVRRAIVSLLSNAAFCETCREASDSDETLQKATKLLPDVALLDISMPGVSGLETARLLRKLVPGTKVLIITHHDTRQLLPFAREVGAVGCLDKSLLGSELIPALKNILSTRASADEQSHPSHS